MIKDLELLLEKLYEEGNYDAESAILRFGHGDCHELTWALYSKYKAPVISIVAEYSNTLVHSCVLINQNTTLDAYGINSVEKTLERYNKLSLINLKEKVIIKYNQEEWIKEYSVSVKESTENILFDFKPIEKLLDISLEKIFQYKRR